LYCTNGNTPSAVNIRNLNTSIIENGYINTPPTESITPTQDDDNDSIFEDMVDNYVTTIEIAEEPQTEPREPITFDQVAQPPPDASGTPIVRVALMDFTFKPTPGETYVVNPDGHMIKMKLNVGKVYQVNVDGCLHEIIFPIPLK
jgi:hypothetical protein